MSTTGVSVRPYINESNIYGLELLKLYTTTLRHNSKRIPTPAPVLRSRYDDYMLSIYPQHEPTNPVALKKLLFLMGATEETLLDYLAIHNKQWDDLIDKMPGRKFPSMGVRASFRLLVPALIIGQYARTNPHQTIRVFLISTSPTLLWQFASGTVVCASTGSIVSTSSIPFNKVL